MNAQRRKAVVALLGMGAAAALAKAGVPTRKIAEQWETNLAAMFPRAFGAWRVDDSLPVVLPAPDVQAKLNELYNQVLARSYIDSSDSSRRVMLSVAYGGDQSDSTKAHLPDVCYPAQGFQRVFGGEAVLSLGGRLVPVRRLVMKLGGRIEPITYWLTVGELALSGITERKLAQMRYGLRGLIPDGMLVRVSTIDHDFGRAFDVHRAFLSDLAPAIPPGARSRVLGRAETSA